MDNLRRLLPHTKKESKMDKRDKLFAINEVYFHLCLSLVKSSM